MAFARHTLSALFAPRRRSAGPLLLCAFLSSTAWAVGCSKPEEAKVDRSKTSDKAEAIPTDFVLNPFMPDDKEHKAQVQVRGGDGGVSAPLAAGSASGTAAAAHAPPGEEEDAAGQEKVLEPGAEPRAERRYAFAIGKPETRVANIKISANGTDQPGLKVTMSIVASGKASKGNGFLMQVKIVKLELVPNNEKEKALVAQAGAALAQATGMVAQFEVTNRGKKSALQMAAPDGKKLGEAAEQVAGILTQATDLMLPPLPVAPIGVGGKWEQRNSQTSDGSKSEVTSTFTLKSFADGSGVIVGDNLIKATSMQQDPRSQRTLKESVEGKGAYEWTLRFDKLPTKVGGEVINTVVRSMGDKSQTQTVKVKQTFEEPGAK